MNGEWFTLRDVTVRRNGRKVLAGLDWALREGECAVVLGPSGGGKTVFLQTLLGLAPPDSGVIETPGATDGERFATVAVMFQEDALLEDRSGAANLAVAAEERLDLYEAAPSAATREAIDAVLRRVRLDPERVRHLRPSALSGGMRRRVALARALIRRPRVLVADEPTTGLDTASAAAVYDVLEELTAPGGMTALMVSHDPVCAARLGRPVYFFRPGERAMARWEPPAGPFEARLAALRAWADAQTASLPAPADADADPPAAARPSTGARLMDAVDALGRGALLFGRLARAPSPVMFLRNLREWGSGTIPLTALIFVLVGMVMEVQAEAALLPYGGSRYLPELVALGLLRLAPILTGFLVAGRCGSAIGAQTGYMELSGQFRVLRTMRIDPARTLFPPLVAALALATPLLALGGIAAGALGAALALGAPISRAGITLRFFLIEFPGHLGALDLAMVALKGVLIGAGVAAIAFGGGARPKRSPEEISQAMTSGLVAAFIWTTVVDTLLSLVRPI